MTLIFVMTELICVHFKDVSTCYTAWGGRLKSNAGFVFEYAEYGLLMLENKRETAIFLHFKRNAKGNIW